MPGVFEISVATEFSAAHSLQGYPGNCSQVHGHNWTVEVFVRCRALNDIGIGIDFREVKRAIKESIENLDHSCLNEHPAFERMKSLFREYRQIFIQGSRRENQFGECKDFQGEGLRNAEDGGLLLGGIVAEGK